MRFRHRPAPAACSTVFAQIITIATLLLCAEHAAHAVTATESQLPLQSAWGTYGTLPGEFSGAFGIAVNASRMLYMAERSGNRIQEFDPNGNSVTLWGATGSGNGQFNAPAALAVDAAGNVYVADTGNNRVQKFTGTGTYLTQWGTLGTGNGQFNGLQGIAVDGAGNVYTMETTNARVQKFTSAGAFVTKWGSLGSGNGQFDIPMGIAATSGGSVYVVEFNNHRVQRFTSGGAYVSQWGSYGFGPGLFFYTRSIAVDPYGFVYVTDSGCKCVQKFTGDGTFVCETSPTAAFTGLQIPAGIAIDYLGNLYASDPVYDRMLKFGHLPRVAAVTDIGSDQGRQVRLRIAATGADTLGSLTVIQGYEVYRQISGANGLAAQLASSRRPASPASIQREGWDYLLTVPARGDTSYSVVIPTLADSGAGGTHWSSFFVSATTAMPTENYWSAADSGYSLDNLPPAVPAPFAAAYVGGATALHWGRNTESDFWYYKIYRGTAAGFTPSAATLVATRSDTGYVDPGTAGRYYALSAVDVNGNESGYASVTPGGTLAVGDGGALAFALAGPRPNPARGGRLGVEFVLSAPLPARIEVLDVAGRVVERREVGSLGLGRHSLDLAAGRALPAGLYLVRLTQGSRVRSVRAVVMD
jgi:DNA-binding beta-propeller fold protein YncE